jgi:penicillin-binding protein 2
MARRDATGEKSTKANTLLVLALLVLALVTGRLFHLQVIQAEELRKASENNRLRSEHVPALRGRILDREGRVLADNRPSFWCMMDPLAPEYLEDPAELDRTLDALAVLLGEDREWLANKVERERFSSPLGMTLKGDLSDLEVASIEERSSELPGVWIEAKPIRRYPHGKLAAHLLGCVGEVTAEEVGGAGKGGYKPGDFIGRGGIEEQMEGHLRGVNGRKCAEVNALGIRVDPASSEERAAEPGEDLVLALDLDVQSWVERELKAFPAGAVVVVRIDDGGIVAMASKPSFDPNKFARGLSRQEWKALEGDKLCPLINRCVQATYPPGSTFKLVTAAAALEEGVISPDDRPVNCPGFYILGNRRYGCWKETGHGRLDLIQAVAQSCDCYFYHLGRELGVERLSAWMVKLGLDTPTGVDLPVEKRSFVPDPEWYDKRYGERGWTEGLALNLAIGQGELLTTPLKLATVAMAVGGSGRWPVPHLTRDAASADFGTWDVSEETLDLLRRAMLEVVQGEKGSGRRAAVPGINVGGKTGTVQNPHGEDHSVFIGFAPWPSPEIAISVFLENSGHGGEKAAPLAGRVLGYYFGTLSAENTVNEPAVQDEAPGPVGGGE